MLMKNTTPIAALPWLSWKFERKEEAISQISSANVRACYNTEP